MASATLYYPTAHQKVSGVQSSRIRLLVRTPVYMLDKHGHLWFINRELEIGDVIEIIGTKRCVRVQRHHLVVEARVSNMLIHLLVTRIGSATLILLGREWQETVERFMRGHGINPPGDFGDVERGFLRSMYIQGIINQFLREDDKELCRI